MKTDPRFGRGKSYCEIFLLTWYKVQVMTECSTAQSLKNRLAISSKRSVLRKALYTYCRTPSLISPYSNENRKSRFKVCADWNVKYGTHFNENTTFHAESNNFKLF